LRPLRELTKHLTTRADDSRATPVKIIIKVYFTPTVKLKFNFYVKDW